MQPAFRGASPAPVAGVAPVAPGAAVAPAAVAPAVAAAVAPANWEPPMPMAAINAMREVEAFFRDLPQQLETLRGLLTARGATEDVEQRIVRACNSVSVVGHEVADHLAGCRRAVEAQEVLSVSQRPWPWPVAVFALPLVGVPGEGWEMGWKEGRHRDWKGCP